MPEQKRTVRAVFENALEIEPEGERNAYLDKICGDDISLRQDVDSLLQAYLKADSFLESPAPGLPETIDQPAGKLAAGQVIGSYKLREQLGVGGFGVVWAAQQFEPISRKVALKIIKPGMDSETVVARFEAERQALALMDHPNIARVLDAGTTDTGHPYFVMELIRGVPITEYCDSTKLSIRQRLVLFTDVCRAVQHAHQKGIIHRDIKPSNVLVTLHDGVPVPKVIDFGIAKALNQQLTDKTIYTRVHQAIGTLAYMSPEQAELSGLDIDTRADVYGLGALLYELLTGQTPLKRERLEKAALLEACRLVREVEPPRLSARISSMGEAATSISECRNTEPRKLQQLVRGDLDLITMKALEKDRTRRYETASAMSGDVTRYLNGEPIEARPPSTTYRLSKFLQRNPGPVIAASLVVFALCAGIVGTTLALRKAYHIQKELCAYIIENATASAMNGDIEQTSFLMDNASEIGATEYERDLWIGIAELHGGKCRESISRLEKLQKAGGDNVAILAALATAYLSEGKIDKCLDLAAVLRPLTPETRQEHLLKAHAEVYLDSNLNIKALRALVEDDSTWDLAHVVLAETLAQNCLDTGEFDVAVEAVERAETGVGVLPKNVYALSVYLHSLHVAIRTAKRKSIEVKDLPRWEAAAERIAERLDRYENYPLGRGIRALYYEHAGNLKKADLDFQAAAKGGRLFESLYSGFLFRQHRSNEAIELYSPYTAYLYADLPDGEEQSLAKYAEMGEGKDLPIQQRTWIQLNLVYAGKYELALEEWKNIAKEADYPQLYMLQYPIWLFSGEKEPHEILEHAEASGVRKQKAAANYHVGIHYVNQKQRAKAIEHFDECLRFDIFMDNVLFSAEGFLDRLNKNTSWPYRSPW